MQQLELEVFWSVEFTGTSYRSTIQTGIDLFTEPEFNYSERCVKQRSKQLESECESLIYIRLQG